MKSKNKILFGSLAVVIAALLWSLDGTFLRPHLYVLPSVLVVFLEHTLGCIVLAPFLFLFGKELKLITKKQWVTIFWVALFGGALGTTFMTKALFLTGFKDISVVILLQKFQPIFAIVLAVIFLKEKFPPKFYIYAGLAIIGGYFVTFKEPTTIKSVVSATGAIAMYSLLAAFAWGSSTTFGKYSLKNINYGLLAALRFGFTVLIMLTPAFKYLSQIPQVGGRQWGTLAIIVFTSGALSMYLYYYGLKRIPASLATLCELAWPVSAVIFDYFLNHNVLSATQIIGGLVLIAAVYRVALFNRPREIVGVVKPGNNQGGSIGARTANLDVSLAQKLPKGLYASEVYVGDQKYEGLLYYGFNSFSNADCLEVHLLNFGGDVYGKEIKVVTERYLRLPKKFKTVEELAGQIKKDLAEAKS